MVSDTQNDWLAPFGGSEQVDRGLRLHTLVRLRWLAVIGQTGAIVWVYFVLGFQLPLGACLAVIALSAWLNVFLSLRWRTSIRLNERYAAALLAYDLIQLAVLLYMTGGLENPFSFLFLVPVTVSATSLPLERTIWLCGIALLAVTILAFKHMPLPWGPADEIILPSLYISGVWAALCCGLIFSALYVSKIATESREMSDALAATEEVLAREQKLHALDGLAAAAAHELGTPLATISLVAHELERDHRNDDNLREDLELLVSQADRCRDILSKLADRDAQSDEMFARLKVLVMIDEIADPLRGPDVEIKVNAPAKSGVGISEPVFPRNPAIIYGLGNLMENAVDFAANVVEIDISWDSEEVVVVIRDDGPGFAQDVIDRLGEPFVTTRPGYGGNAVSPDRDTHQGMGLGFFIAKTVLERSGASVALANRAGPDTGAIVHIAWPRASIEVEKTPQA
ncbi:MAG: ActS/PrrB/RegB family redox-sensitive histidine kinase [Rhizobiales bacterium]|nr:ActS/PrrB/RegB family redox-sensitive histidine kinase [Hyphomicrobiales bacterium]